MDDTRRVQAWRLRRGLLILLVAAAAISLLVTLFGDDTVPFGGGLSGSTGSVQAPSLNPSWEELPGAMSMTGPEFDQDWPPRPGPDEPVISERLADDAVSYRIDYLTGAVYSATANPDGSASFEYRLADDKWSEFALGTIAFFLMGLFGGALIVGVIALALSVSSRLSGTRASDSDAANGRIRSAAHR